MKTFPFPKLYLFIVLLISYYGYGQVPEYYNDIDFTQEGEDLKQQLANLVTVTHITLLPYTSSQLDTWDAVKQTDLDPDNSSNVLLFYGYDDLDGNSQTDYTRDVDLSCHVSSCSGLWTREHVYAKSLASPSLSTDQPGPGTDAHNLRACDGNMNSTRSNRLFHDGSGNAYIVSANAWYPGDEWRGDVARMMMYMHLRYPDQCPANDVASSSNTVHPDMPDIFLQWNAQDPVTEYELQRNTVLENMQGNRNPFIDNPYLATAIWGGQEAEDIWGTFALPHNRLNQFKVYPTVVSSKLYVSHPTAPQVKMAVYNTYGQRIKVEFNNHATDMSHLASGMYMLRITDNRSATKVFKFIKR